MKWTTTRLTAGLGIACVVLSCTTKSVVNTPVETQGGNVSITGFVVRPGEYPFHTDMTVGDALALAGGHAHCEHCATMFADKSHPSYSGPIILMRAGVEQKIHKAQWETFILQPGDAIKVRHIWL
jgi:hypothetical protein